MSNRIYTDETAAFRYRVERLPGAMKRVHLRPEEDQVAMSRGFVEPLIAVEDFETAQIRLAAKKKYSVRNNRNPEGALLRGGFTRCGYCGHTATVNNGGQSRGGRQRKPTYGCHGWAKDHHGCPSYAVDVEELDAMVWAKIKERMENPELIAAEAVRVRREHPAIEEIAAVDCRLADIAQEQQRLARSIAKLEDDDAAASLQSELKGLTRQKRQFLADRVVLLDQQRSWRATQDRLNNLSATCHRVRGKLATMTYAERRQLLTALDVRVMLYRADHTHRWEIVADFDGIVSRTASSSSATARPLPLVRRQAGTEIGVPFLVTHAALVVILSVSEGSPEA